MRNAAFVLALVAGAGIASAQQSVPSLADVARQSEAARPTSKKARRSYTNADLSDRKLEIDPAASNADAKVTQAPVATQAAVKADAATAPSAPAASAAAATPTPQQTEAFWKGRADTIRSEVDRAQTRLLGFRKPVDSPTLKALNDREVAKYTEVLKSLEKQWDRLESQAKAVNVNPQWLGVRPNFNP